MRARQPLPSIWLVSDARNDAALEAALRCLPRGSGVIFRHYHLPPAKRTARLARIAQVCRSFGHRLEVAGVGYGPPAPHRRLATVHSLREIGRANRMRAEAVLLSPVFPTRSHPDANPLGPLRFRLLAARALMPAIALGGIDTRRARVLRPYAWAAVDGLSNRRRKALCTGRSNR